MKSLFLIAILLCFSTLFAGSGEKDRISSYYQITKTVKSKYVKPDHSKIKFTVKNVYGTMLPNQKLIYSIDGKTDTTDLDKNDSFFLTTSKGKHIFQFYYSEDFMELYTDSINLKGGYQTNIDLYFTMSQNQNMIEKPVIYLYPEMTQTVDVTLKPVGELQFTYPAYENGWKITATPDGTLTHNGKNYPYLFWDAAMNRDMSSVDVSQGFVVEKENTIAFLEEQLNIFGFTPQERTDFITYWGPRLASEKRAFIQFVWGKATDQFGQLNISPQPDNINRVYIQWKSLKDGETIPQPTPQIIPVLDRSGFDVLEWGGVELTNHEL
ncbi:MAG: hypothetical protein CHH17_11570 [Candidatus Fluviicola riflensis]|nr:MAG: hypothetical protein CHH17_11570 [Candidatus Fluviicola riflensis]